MLKAYLWLQLLLGGLTVLEEVRALIFGRGRWQPNWLRLVVGVALLAFTIFELANSAQHRVSTVPVLVVIVILDGVLVASFLTGGWTGARRRP